MILKVPVGGAQKVLCVAKVIPIDLYSQKLYEAGVKVLKINITLKMQITLLIVKNFSPNYLLPHSIQKK